MDTNKTSEIYKITAINADGAEIIGYVLPAQRRMYKKMMLDEYGNVDEEGMAIADLPDDVRPQVEQHLQGD